MCGKFHILIKGFRGNKQTNKKVALLLEDGTFFFSPFIESFELYVLKF